MRDTVIAGARVIDPASGHDAVADVLIRNGLIADIGLGQGRPDGADYVDAMDAVLSPGLFDMRVELGEPGREDRETIKSVCRAAAAGGITSLCALPDSAPATDDPALVRALIARGEDTGSLSILPYGAVTRGCLGEQMAEMALMKEAGAVAFTDGARAIGPTRLMRLVLSYTKGFGGIVVQHPEDPSLAEGGAATQGELATRLGLPAIPAVAETIQVARDIALARNTGGRLHFAHISTGDALALIRAAKAEGLAVTCDTAPPYFDLNEIAIGNFRTYAKLSPPLRTEADREAVVAALADGTIDAVASDHQPRDADDKRLPFALASAGGTGIATLLPITLAQFHSGKIGLMRAIELMTAGPARVLGLSLGHIAKGAVADLCLFNPDRAWKIEAGKLPGKAQNTPFDGRAVEGRVLGTWKAGKRVFG
ncbi:dihydroorotase [Acidisoma cellulosilyticum]|uniref:dihydroorotase n=1 Tax=Acidisoma cellulosilyticum TaxID=2802395 RepID=UPI00387315D4